MRQYHRSYFHRQILADVIQFDKQIKIKMYILKTYIKLCRICAILYTCTYASVFSQRVDPASPLLSQTVHGAVLRCKTKVAWTFIFTHINYSHVHSHLISKCTYVARMKFSSFICCYKKSHKYSIKMFVLNQLLYVQKQAGQIWSIPITPWHGHSLGNTSPSVVSTNDSVVQSCQTEG